MYASDYKFAAAPSTWTTTLNKYNSSSITSVNWMYMGLNEQTITRNTDKNYIVFYLPDGGNLNFSNTGGVFAIRPTFYLLPSVVYSDGSGTQSNPIRLEV